MHAVRVLGTACGAGYLRVRVRAVHGLRRGLHVRAREKPRAGYGIEVGGLQMQARAGHGLRSRLRVRARERARAGHGIAVGGLWRWGACWARLAERVARTGV